MCAAYFRVWSGESELGSLPPDLGCNVTSWSMLLLPWSLLWRRAPNQHFFSYIVFLRYFVLKKVTNPDCNVVQSVNICIAYMKAGLHRSRMLYSYIWHAGVAARTDYIFLRILEFKKEPTPWLQIDSVRLTSFICWLDITPCREWSMVSRELS